MMEWVGWSRNTDGAFREMVGRKYPAYITTYIFCTDGAREGRDYL